MHQDPEPGPDTTAVRVALWRALHLEVDAPPCIFKDDIGRQLVDPDEGWRQRPDMDPQGTRAFRASIVARARFVDDLVIAEVDRGVRQYVLLGAGLDTFAQRRPDVASRLQVFEVDRPGPQQWKQRRLAELGIPVPGRLHFVPVDFEARGSWWQQLLASGFDPAERAIVGCTGVTQYLTREAITATLRQAAGLAPGSTMAMTFLLPLELLDADLRGRTQGAAQGARAAGTPFVSFFTPAEMLDLARAAGFEDVRHVSSADLVKRYFAGRSDGLRPVPGEEFLLARTQSEIS